MGIYDLKIKRIKYKRLDHYGQTAYNILLEADHCENHRKQGDCLGDAYYGDVLGEAFACFTLGVSGGGAYFALDNGGKRHREAGGKAVADIKPSVIIRRVGGG